MSELSQYQIVIQ